MAVETAADRAGMLDPEEFGTLARLDGVDIRGVFDAGDYAEDAFGDVALQGVSTRLTVAAADVVDAEPGAAVVVDGADYRLRRIEPDGTGLAVLVLSAV